MLEEDSPERRYVECSECARTMQAIDGLLRNSSDCIFLHAFLFVPQPTACEMAGLRSLTGLEPCAPCSNQQRQRFPHNSSSWCPATVKDNASQRPVSSASLLCETSVKKRCPSHIDRLRDVRSRKTKFQNFEWKQWAPPCDASSENTLQICQLCNFAHLLQLKQIICFME